MPIAFISLSGSFPKIQTQILAFQMGYLIPYIVISFLGHQKLDFFVDLQLSTKMPKTKRKARAENLWPSSNKKVILFILL